MENLKDKSVGQIVAEDFRASQVFENHKIDFCCSGGRSLQEVAKEQGLDVQKLVDEIVNAPLNVEGGGHDFDSWPLDLLADYITKTHHRYSEKQIPVIKPYLNKIVDVHGDSHPELIEIKKIFDHISGVIAAHTKKEEIILFPFIKRMVQANENKTEFENPKAKSASDPINMLEEEHDEQGDAFKRIAELSNDYTNPSDGCNTYKVTLGFLQDLERDLHKHIHLENNILFPKALELEKELTA